MDDAEHRGVGADAEGEGQERGEGEPALGGEPPRGRDEIPKQGVHVDASRRLARAGPAADGSRASRAGQGGACRRITQADRCRWNRRSKRLKLVWRDAPVAVGVEHAQRLRRRFDLRLRDRAVLVGVERRQEGHRFPRTPGTCPGCRPGAICPSALPGSRSPGSPPCIAIIAARSSIAEAVPSPSPSAGDRRLRSCGGRSAISTSSSAPRVMTRVPSGRFPGLPKRTRGPSRRGRSSSPERRPSPSSSSEASDSGAASISPAEMSPSSSVSRARKTGSLRSSRSPPSPSSGWRPSGGWAVASSVVGPSPFPVVGL